MVSWIGERGISRGMRGLGQVSAEWDLQRREVGECSREEREDRTERLEASSEGATSGQRHDPQLKIKSSLLRDILGQVLGRIVKHDERWREGEVGGVDLHLGARVDERLAGSGRARVCVESGEE